MIDVGKQAGVSSCTVSRAFNSPDTVRPEILERVLYAAEELNYSPNAAAKALRLQKTSIFGVILPTLEHDMFATLVNSFQEVLNCSGYAAIVVTTGFDNTKLLDAVRTVVGRGAEGLLLVGEVKDKLARKFIRRMRLPVVTTYSFVEDEIPSIGIDNYLSARQAIDWLINLGHRRMAMIAGPTKANDRQQSRIRAFREAGKECSGKSSWPVIEHPYSDAYTAGGKILCKLLDEKPDITAIICNSDTFAVGALLEAQRLGIRIPADLSIIGHDDLELAAAMNPPLSTIKVPAAEMGRLSAQALLNAKLNGMPIMSVCLETSLFTRGSTGPAPSCP